jgi:hypothetical protein
MRTNYRRSSLVLITVLAAVAQAVSGAEPPDVVTSDANQDTAMGTHALYSLTAAGHADTAAGFQALYANTSGHFNTATGADALYSNTTGLQNTAAGAETLYTNTSGENNSGFGMEALFSNTSGDNNTACGYNALFYNTTGGSNTASGVNALFRNTVGTYNSADGMQALYFNTSGERNTASGYNALYANTTGSSNTGSGNAVLNSNTSGSSNTASGYYALYSNTTGSDNIAQGYEAGYNLTTGSNNIDIGNKGVAAESGTIRIGTKSIQTATYVAGIYGTSVSGNAVVVNSNGQLGVVTSSERYKTAITPMGSTSEKLKLLRPVTFHLKSDPHGAMQYGLIAEEVAKVYPDLVIRGESGQIDGVRYDELAPILLNELQQQHTQMTDKIDAQAAEIRNLKNDMAELRDLKDELRAALVEFQASDSHLARR